MVALGKKKKKDSTILRSESGVLFVILFLIFRKCTMQHYKNYERVAPNVFMRPQHFSIAITFEGCHVLAALIIKAFLLKKHKYLFIVLFNRSFKSAVTKVQNNLALSILFFSGNRTIVLALAH